MKVLHLNSSDINGGAARAAYRLHRALLEAGINSQMLVQFKLSDDFTVLGSDTQIKKGWARLRSVLDRLPVHWYPNKSKTLFSPAFIPSLGLAGQINALNPDVVHLHWINSGLLRIEEIAKIKAPIIWSLHDNWAFTGGCHIMWDCTRYKEQCGLCPRLGSEKRNDLSSQVFLRKLKTFNKLKNLTIVGLSRWISDCAKNSTLFKKSSVVNLPNLIDTTIFSPVDQSLARSLFNLPEKKLVLFGAMNAVSDINKGFYELSQALKLPTDSDIELVVFGSSPPKTAPDLKFKIHYLGHLHDNVSLRLLYSAADVMVVPSLQENLSNAIMESLACGTPVVGFNVGGNADLIDHQINGYLAQAFDAADLAEGIDWVLKHTNAESLRQNARQKVLSTFDSHLVVQQYIQLYEQMLKQR